jgi:16S rRNA (uracil1498-N3)-methyltransferase
LPTICPRKNTVASILSRVHRFFAPTLDAGDEVVTLPKDEGEHLARVLRLGPGDEVAVFDGRGHEYQARVLSVLRREVRLQLLTRIEPAAELPVALTLAQAVLKGDKMDDVVRDAVMLGVAAVQPLVTRRTEVTVATLVKSARVERWRRVALASAKQCGRAVLPDIRTPLTLTTYLDDRLQGPAYMLVEPSSTAAAAPLAVLRHDVRPPDAALLVGPEGGWAEEEWQVARARGVRLCTLGARTLRADAVPLVGLSILGFVWETT